LSQGKERLGSPRLRLFVALDLPDAFLDCLVDWRERHFSAVPGARLPRRGSLHVTLVFLGYQYERDVDRIAGICFGRSAGPFELRATEASAIPPRRPRLYALALSDEEGALAAWQADLSSRLRAARLYEPEKRPFWAHVTLVRGKRDRPLARLDDVPSLPASLKAPFTPERATLYRSTLTPQGAVYNSLGGLELRRELPSGDRLR
jgi:RNA 2',3'-cyclic 3'-phosphodiesterase